MNKNIKITFLIGTIAFVSSTFFISVNNVDLDIKLGSDLSRPRVKNAGFWNLNSTPIHIDDLNPNINWSKTAAEKEWCSGTGTWDDPYLIENVTIDGLYEGSCISIKNSIVYFIIRNCTLINKGLGGDRQLDAGIFLYNQTNGLIINNTCSNIYGTGISVYRCNNITVWNNTVRYNDRFGIAVQFRGNNSVIGNIISHTNEFGIYLGTTSQNNISSNIISKGTGGGFQGIYAQGSSNNIITSNQINNFPWGVRLYDCSDNILYLNEFRDNDEVAKDYGNNYWDNGSIGNYYDDYRGLDQNDDGIGDTPYIIDDGIIDRFPLILNLPPEITVSFPTTNYIFSKSAPYYDISIYDANLEEFWYELGANPRKVFFTEMIGTINQTMWEDLPRGNISIRFYANDTRENVAYVEVIVFKDFPPKSVPAIPGYSLILVIGVITIISVVSIKRQRRI